MIPNINKDEGDRSGKRGEASCVYVERRIGSGLRTIKDSEY